MTANDKKGLIAREESLDDDRGLNLVRGVRAKDIPRLFSIGIRSYDELARTDPELLHSKLNWSHNKITDVILHAKALVHKRPFQKAPLELPQGGVYFYDIETFGRLTYLHGVIKLFGQEREERSFLARYPFEEGVAWREFLEYLAQDNNAVIYSWTDYEKGFIHKLWDNYGGNREGWRLLSGLQDQCALVKNHFALPTRRYGLKNVAPVFGFQWHTPNPSGRKAEQWYKLWIETGDEEFLNEITVYNLDDVRAMEVIHHGIKKLNQ